MNDITTNPLHPVEALILSNYDEALHEKAERIQLVVLDVDGVLTDGRLWMGPQGEVMKPFHALDGYGLKMLQRSGIEMAFVSGRGGPIVERRAADLGIDAVFSGVRDKLQTVQQLVEQQNRSWSQVAAMGDDLIDLPLLRRCGLSFCVPDAPRYVQNDVHCVTKAAGGMGAVREMADFILASKGCLRRFLEPHQAVPMAQ